MWTSLVIVLQLVKKFGLFLTIVQYKVMKCTFPNLTF